MRKTSIALVSLVLCLFAGTTGAQQPTVDITGDTTWTGEVTVDGPVRVTKGTLTIAPGTVVTFKAEGSVWVGPGCALTAKGLLGTPVRFTAEKTGQVRGSKCHIVLEHCEVTGVGVEDQHKRAWWLDATAGEQGIAVRQCEITDSGGVTVVLDGGGFEMTGCELRESRGGVQVRGRGSAQVAGNTLDGAGISVGEGTRGVVRGNVVLRATLSAWKTETLLVEGNYVHQPAPGGSYGLLRTVGTVRNNVVRGGSWVTSHIGGEIRDNVFISLPHEEARKLEGGFDRNCTHEHICGLVPNATVVRNIFVGASYGAVMGIGDGTASDSVIRNNTFDMRGSGNALYLNHLPKSDPKNVVARNNLFIRSGTVVSEKPVHDTFSCVDYNLWCQSGLRKDRGRFWKVTMTGKEPGQPGFGANDVPPYGKDDEQPAPAAVVLDPDVRFPFTDEDMLTRKHTVEEVLKHYRDAYTPKPGSPAVDAGDPADKDDPEVKDGRPDIGAVEAAGK